jgi:hypothetical protein
VLKFSLADITQIIKTLVVYASFDERTEKSDRSSPSQLTLDAQFDAGVAPLFPLSGPAWSITQFYMFAFSGPITHYFRTVSASMREGMEWACPGSVVV